MWKELGWATVRKALRRRRDEIKRGVCNVMVWSIALFFSSITIENITTWAFVSDKKGWISHALCSITWVSSLVKMKHVGIRTYKERRTTP